MTGIVRFDMHVHSRHSPDGRLTVQQLVEQAAFAGLSGFALTDHNTVDGQREIPGAVAAFPRVLIVPGVEVSTREGHLLVYGVSELPPVGEPLDKTTEWVRSRGAISVLAHPFRWSHGAGRRVGAGVQVDGVETVNGHSGELANAKAAFLAARRGLPVLAGSDTHRSGEIGSAATEFQEEVASVEDVWQQIRSRRTVATGRSLSVGARIWLGTRSTFALLGRGLRPI